MVDADLGEMVGPDVQRVAVAHREREMVEWLGRCLARPGVGPQAQHDDHVAGAVLQRDVGEVVGRRELLEPEHGRVPLSARRNVADHELQVGEAEQRRVHGCVHRIGVNQNQATTPDSRQAVMRSAKPSSPRIASVSAPSAGAGPPTRAGVSSKSTG